MSSGNKKQPRFQALFSTLEKHPATFCDLMTLTNKKSVGLTVIIFCKLVQPMSRQVFGLENSAFTNITLLKESRVNFKHNKLILPTVSLLGLAKFPGNPYREHKSAVIPHRGIYPNYASS